MFRGADPIGSPRERGAALGPAERGDADVPRRLPREGGPAGLGLPELPEAVQGLRPGAAAGGPRAENPRAGNLQG